MYELPTYLFTHLNEKTTFRSNLIKLQVNSAYFVQYAYLFSKLLYLDTTSSVYIAYYYSLKTDRKCEYTMSG